MVTTHVDDARERAAAEREAVTAKIEAFDAFLDRVSGISPDTPHAASPVGAAAGSVTRSAAAGSVAPGATGGSVGRNAATGDDGCAAVRSAFAETVRPHSVADLEDAEPLLETVRSELSDRIAVAIAPTTDASFSPACKGMVRAETRKRREEAAVFRRALDREVEHLEDVAAAVDHVTAWIARVDERPLTELGFDELAGRHETLAGHRERCEALAADRQAFLRETSNDGVEVGVRHSSLPPYLYEDFPMDHPVLATAARLDDVCAECQRAVRDHLVRRG